MMRLRREDPRVVGSFRLHRRLGAGGMGVVYLGSDRRGQRVALKVIRPDLAEDQEFRSRFAREVSAARRIRGGCTARLVAADLEADRPWFATQYVPGPSLHDKVAEEGPLSAAEVASIGAALSEGLVAVHEAGVVHRDLKPSNILLSPKGPRIIDFGIAWATGASTLTHVGTAVGSPGFLAPEQVRGAAVTPATDVFALGATLAYACDRRLPLRAGQFGGHALPRGARGAAAARGAGRAGAAARAPVWPRTRRSGPARCQLSLRLKEIAAREAHGPSGGPLENGPGAGAGWERAERRPRTGRPGSGPRSTRASAPSGGTAGTSSPRPHPSRPPAPRDAAPRPAGPASAAGTNPRTGGRTGRRAPAARPTGRNGARAPVRTTSRRAPARPRPPAAAPAASSCSSW